MRSHREGEWNQRISIKIGQPNNYFLSRLMGVVAVLWLQFGAVYACAAETPEKISTDQDQASIALTIYNDNLALVRDVRAIFLDADLNRLAWRDVCRSVHVNLHALSLQLWLYSSYLIG